MSGSYAWRCIFCGTPVAHMQAAHLRCISRVPGWQIDRARAGPGLVVWGPHPGDAQKFYPYPEELPTEDGQLEAAIREIVGIRFTR